jgi:hypothetical protein
MGIILAFFACAFFGGAASIVVEGVKLYIPMPLSRIGFFVVFWITDVSGTTIAVLC